MSDEWVISVRVAPHSMGNGRDNDQKLVGPLVQCYGVEADNFDTAVKLAKAFATGINSNPMVWMTEIVGVVKQ